MDELTAFDAFKQEWDADSTLEGNINMTLYRQLFPHPYFPYLPSVHNMYYRTSMVPPAHFFFYTALFAIVSTILRVFLYRLVFKPIARFLRLAPEDHDMFAESGLQMTFYACSWLSCAYLVVQEEWFWDPIYVFEGNFPNQPMEIQYYWMTVMYCGWYTFGIISHVFYEERKKDFWEMFIHHAATLILIYLAYTKGYYRLMALTTFSHDICDIFLHFAKMCKYYDNIYTSAEYLQSVVFLPVPVTWIIFRLCLFPYLVVYTCVIQGPLIIGVDNTLNYWIYTPCLVALLCLQFFWFYLVVRIGYRKFYQGGSLHDIREGADRTRKEREKQQ